MTSICFTKDIINFKSNFDVTEEKNNILVFKEVLILKKDKEKKRFCVLKKVIKILDLKNICLVNQANFNDKLFCQEAQVMSMSMSMSNIRI